MKRSRSSFRQSVRRLNRPRRGGTAVEMAIILPILFLFVFGAIEFGRANVMRHTTDNAAYRAARRGIVPGATATEVENIARGVMDVVGARGVQVTITPRVIQLDTEQIRVQVDVPFDENGLLPGFFLRGKTISGTCSMRREDL